MLMLFEWRGSVLRSRLARAARSYFYLGLRYGDSGVYNEVNGVASNLYATNGSTVVPEPSPFQYGRLNNVALAVGRA